MGDLLAEKVKRLTRRPRRTTKITRVQDEKKARLQRMKNRKLADKINETEKQWGRLALENRTKDILLFHTVNNLIEGAATRWSVRYKERRLTREDFVSEFYETAWNVTMAYSWNGPYYLYEHIKKAIQSKGKDMLRATNRDVRRSFHESLALPEWFEDSYPDNTDSLVELVIMNLFVEEELSEQEREVFLKMQDVSSQRKIAQALNKNRRTVSRRIERIQDKLRAYCSESAS